MRRSLFFVFFAFAICFCAMTSAAQAQATRTWVSGVGDDANPCSRTAPCKTFPGAYSKTAVGGEIDVLDPGGFGTITIGHAITIDGGGGVIASILASSTVGINVNAGANDEVTIRNIQINGISQSSFPGTNAINFNSGRTLNVEKCVIENFSGFGINFQPVVRSFLHVVNTVIENTGNNGIIISTTATTGGVNRADVRWTHVVDSNSNGIQIGANSRVGLYSVTSSRNGIASGTGDGILANGANTFVNIDDSLVMNNATSGLHTQNGSLMDVSNSSIYDNGTFGVQTDTGQIFSGLNNRVKGNASGDGSFTGPIPLT
jgi:hypothetical protein